MKDPRLAAHTPVAEALDRSPRISKIFVARHTACVGCYMARFCTLWDTATIYELPWDAFIAELRGAEADDGKDSGGINA